jgi:hypothetical protein
MTPREKHQLLEKVLWILKIPEIVLTAAIVLGIVFYIFGILPVEILLIAFTLRLFLFPLRICIVKMKRNIEKEYHISRGIYVPAVIKIGTKKFDFVRYK